MEGIDIVAATAADAGRVSDLVRTAYEPYVARIGREPAPMTADYEALAEAGEVWLATRDGELVGVVVLQDAGDHLLLDNVAVRPAAQHGGVGACLLRFADAEAARLGRAEIRLYTNELMTENLDYYPRHGYVETHRGEDAGFRRVYFRKTVAGS
ncbi:MAG TPA: GNAT family N-acetyltransferase [Mycobacteriales bacterium]|nr:GNAT family N-acetyltransferase [Mycobacteriales bacterium]